MRKGKRKKEKEKSLFKGILLSTTYPSNHSWQVKRLRVHTFHANAVLQNVPFGHRR